MSVTVARRRDEAGYAAVLVALLVATVFMGVAALGVDTAKWYVVSERLQKAADAAALAAVTYMPNDLPGATAAAERVAARNGFPRTQAGVSIAVTQGDRPSELQVTISSVVANSFGAYLGVTSSTMSRSAVADYTAPAPMGSPCNTFGNEPPSQPAPAAQPTGTALPSTPFPNCNSQPAFWAAIEGAGTDKVQGDRFMTSPCAGTSVYRCSGAKNSEYRSDGYYWAVHVEPEAINTAITVQLYDPAYTRTEIDCSLLSETTSTSLYAKMNAYTTTDGKNRFSKTSTNAAALPYCPGDYIPGSSTVDPFVTTFVLREANDTRNPRIATPINGCTKQFVGSNTPPSLTQLSQWSDMAASTGANTNFNPQMAQLFHQWVPLCTFTPGRAGDFYLQVRTNVKIDGGTAVLNRNDAGSTKTSLIYTGNPRAADLAGNTTAGVGLNAFALRAVPSDVTKAQYIAVAGNESMPILQNKRGSTATFNLIRALPNTRGQYIAFDFYDPADGAGTSGATVRVVAPEDAEGTLETATTVPNCSHALNDQTYVAAPSCQVTVKAATHNGQLEHVLIPIPDNYDCDASTLGGCWFSVQVTFPDTVTDFTTWSANITGDPVRLIE